MVLFVLAWNLIRSRVGRAMIAVRDQELAAGNSRGEPRQGEGHARSPISAAYAGVAGSLSVMIDRAADGTNPILYFQLSIEFLVAVVIGGAATIIGSGGRCVLLIFLRRNTENLIEGKEVLAPAVFGGALILIVYVLPRRGGRWSEPADRPPHKTPRTAFGPHGATGGDRSRPIRA